MTKELIRSQNATLNKISLRSQNVILENNRGKHRKFLPFVFTEQGVAGLSGVLNGKEVYHIGASPKDLGKRWFAFSKMDKGSVASIINAISGF